MRKDPEKLLGNYQRSRIRKSSRYTTSVFNQADDVVADLGAAEGNFSLSIINKVKKIYIFEYDKEWVEALKAPFGWAETKSGN
jgi:predicted RNA methylase